MQAVATFCAIASGVAMAMVNLVFGKFITVITEYTAGHSTPAVFRSEAAHLAYVLAAASMSWASI